MTDQILLARVGLVSALYALVEVARFTMNDQAADAVLDAWDTYERAVIAQATSQLQRGQPGYPLDRS